MGYLVKASFNAEPRAYALEGIKTDVEAKLLPATALVRHEKQGFWYSVDQLLGKEPVPSFRYRCKHCKTWLIARKIDVGLQLPCEKCGKMPKVPNIEREGRFMMVTGGVSAALGILVTVCHYYAPLPSAIAVGSRFNLGFIFLILAGLFQFYQGWSRPSQLRLKTPQDRN